MLILQFCKIPTQQHGSKTKLICTQHFFIDQRFPTSLLLESLQEHKQFADFSTIIATQTYFLYNQMSIQKKKNIITLLHKYNQYFMKR